MSGFVLAGDSSGSITLQANAVAGSNTITLPAETGTALTTANTQIATKSEVIGVGQSWQNVAASRAFGVTYTNTTGKPIQVIVSHSSAVQYTEFYMTIDGLTIMHGRNAMPNTTNGRDTAFVIVPAGSTYSFTGGSLAAWLELR